MLDLTTIPDEVFVARGKYSSLGKELRDKRKRAVALCSEFQTMSSMVLRQVQTDNDEPSGTVKDMLAYGRKTIDALEECASEINELVMYRAELYPIAWGKRQ